MNDSGRKNPLLQDFLISINILQKKIQGGDPLDEPLFNPNPLLMRNQTRQRIKGENPLRARRVVVNRESDPTPQKGSLQGGTALSQPRRIDQLQGIP